MKHIIESVEELYDLAAHPPKQGERGGLERGGLGVYTGEMIIDQLVDVLKRSRALYPQDAALLLDVDVADLRAAVRMLTGMNIHTLMLEWRLLQAQELMREGKITPDQVARRCGWQNQRTMNNALKTHLGVTVSMIKHSE